MQIVLFHTKNFKKIYFFIKLIKFYLFNLNNNYKEII